MKAVKEEILVKIKIPERIILKLARHKKFHVTSQKISYLATFCFIFRMSFFVSTADKSS